MTPTCKNPQIAVGVVVGVGVAVGVTVAVGVAVGITVCVAVVAVVVNQMESPIVSTSLVFWGFLRR